MTIIRSNIQTTHIGRPTLTFVNDTLRNNAKALAEYKTCRDTACANADKTARDVAIAKCAQAIITKYVNIPKPKNAPGVSPPSPPAPKLKPKNTP